MDVYGHRMRFIEEYFRSVPRRDPATKVGQLHAEVFLNFTRVHHGIFYKGLKGFKFGRLRATGEITWSRGVLSPEQVAPSRAA